MMHQTRKQQWAVACPEVEAANAAADVLRKGGNAVDAALAASAMLSVTMPDQTSIGGDAFWLVRTAQNQVFCIDGAGPNAEGTPSPPEEGAYSAIKDPRTVTVPGLIDTWRIANQRFSSLDLRDLLEPAIRVASEGICIQPRLRQAFANEFNSAPIDTEFERVFKHVMTASHLQQQDLAATLETVATNPRDFYELEFPQKAVKRMRQAGSYLTVEDFHRFKANICEPTSYPLFSEHTLWETPPPSQGSLVPFALALHAGLPAAKSAEEDTHYWIETARFMMALRDVVLGDPVSMTHLVEDICSPKFIEKFAALIKPDEVADRDLIDAAISEFFVPSEHSRPLGDTCHLAVIDENGMAVSLVQSIFWDFGSGIIVPGTGVILHNRGFGQLTNPEMVNCARPGLRPMHTLAAAMITDGTGELTAVFGCMGGHAQAQLHLQMLAGLKNGKSAREIVSAPRWFANPINRNLHLEVEEGFPYTQALRERGHNIHSRQFGEDMFGHEQILINNFELVDGSADSRSGGICLLQEV